MQLHKRGGRNRRMIVYTVWYTRRMFSHWLHVEGLSLLWYIYNISTTDTCSVCVCVYITSLLCSPTCSTLHLLRWLLLFHERDMTVGSVVVHYLFSSMFAYVIIVCTWKCYWSDVSWCSLLMYNKSMLSCTQSIGLSQDMFARIASRSDKAI